MKICYLAAANSIHSIRWISYFVRRGHEVAWISLAPPIPEAAEIIRKISFHEIAPSPLADINGRFAFIHLLKAVQQIKKILGQFKPDVLHIHSAGTYGLAGAMSGFKNIILTPWGTDILLASFWKKPLIKYIIKRTRLFTCDGKNTLQKLVEFGTDPKNIHLIRFGTDTEKFRPLPSKQPSPLLRVISTRRLDQIYDVETFIRAAAIVLKTEPQVEFVVAGGGSQSTYLKNLAVELGIHHNVKFEGEIDSRKLPALLQSADIYVSTSLSDSGLAASTAEAMACGLPVIATDTGDNKQWVHEGKGGFVIPIHNSEVLAKKILFCLRRADAIVNYGNYNRKIIVENNNCSTEMRKVEILYSYNRE